MQESTIKIYSTTHTPSKLMTNIFALVFRFLFAAILSIATVITVVILSPFWLVFWIWKQLTEKNADG